MTWQWTCRLVRRVAIRSRLNPTEYTEAKPSRWRSSIGIKLEKIKYIFRSRDERWPKAFLRKCQFDKDAINQMPHPLVEKAKTELEQAQAQLEAALRAWDDSVSELWSTSLALTQAQKRVTHAHELLRDAIESVRESRESGMHDKCLRE
jgi:exonuclease VII small subunit